MSLTEKLAFIASITALCSAVIGPITALFVARAQIRASTISASRKQNIDAISQEIAEYFSVFADWFSVVGMLGQDPEALTPKGGLPPTNIHNVLRIQSQLARHRSRISLFHYIDPEPVEELVQAFLEMERCKKYDDLKPIQERSFKIARTITAGQWKVIQKGK